MVSILITPHSQKFRLKIREPSEDPTGSENNVSFFPMSSSLDNVNVFLQRFNITKDTDNTNKKRAHCEETKREEKEMRIHQSKCEINYLRGTDKKNN